MTGTRQYTFAFLIGLCVFYICLPWWSLELTRWLYAIPMSYQSVHWRNFNRFSIDSIELNLNGDKVLFHNNHFVLDFFSLSLNVEIPRIDYQIAPTATYQAQNLKIYLDRYKLTAMADLLVHLGALSAQASAKWDAQYDKTAGYIGPLEFELAQQDFFGLKIPEQSLFFILSPQHIEGHTSLRSKGNGQVFLDLLCDWKKDSIALLSKIQNMDSYSLSTLGDYLKADWQGMLSIQGSLFNPNNREGTLKLFSGEGRLINFNPQKATRFINPIQQLYELPSLFFEKQDTEDFLFARGGMFATLKNNQIILDRIEFTRSPKHYLVIKGQYDIDQESFNIKLRYSYPSNPLGLSLKLTGRGDTVQIQFQAGDLLRLVPTLILPNIL